MVGKRTMKDLARALVPSRIYFVLVFLAIFAAIGAAVLAWLCERFGAPAWITKEATTMAYTFRVMPVWFLVGGSLSQVAARIDRAITEGRRWWNDRHTIDYDGPPYNDPRWRELMKDG